MSMLDSDTDPPDRMIDRDQVLGAFGAEREHLSRISAPCERHILPFNNATPYEACAPSSDGAPVATRVVGGPVCRLSLVVIKTP